MSVCLSVCLFICLSPRPLAGRMAAARPQHSARHQGCTCVLSHVKISLVKTSPALPHEILAVAYSGHHSGCRISSP